MSTRAGLGNEKEEVPTTNGTSPMHRSRSSAENSQTWFFWGGKKRDHLLWDW
ncbi:hypothetical protein RP20_CCG002763 [Aedes albopictus]|nr:hypothetical protein RP20_CCG002763 [Aedes albopictus]